jgi:hypothetical protein
MQVFCDDGFSVMRSSRISSMAEWYNVNGDRIQVYMGRTSPVVTTKFGFNKVIDDNEVTIVHYRFD